MLLLLTLNIFYTLFYCYNCWVRTSKFELCLRNYSFRQWICFQWLWKIFIVWARTVCCATNFHNYSPNMKLRKDNSVTKIFMTELQKDKFNSDFIQLESFHCNVKWEIFVWKKHLTDLQDFPVFQKMLPRFTLWLYGFCRGGWKL